MHQHHPPAESVIRLRLFKQGLAMATSVDLAGPWRQCCWRRKSFWRDRQDALLLRESNMMKRKTRKIHSVSVTADPQNL